MRLDELQAAKIIGSALGIRGELKSGEELAVILKKRLTKKEMYAVNANALGADKAETAKELNVNEVRLSELVASALKKIKNESVHREFYLSIANLTK